MGQRYTYNIILCPHLEVGLKNCINCKQSNMYTEIQTNNFGNKIQTPILCGFQIQPSSFQKPYKREQLVNQDTPYSAENRLSILDLSPSCLQELLSRSQVALDRVYSVACRDEFQTCRNQAILSKLRDHSNIT